MYHLSNGVSFERKDNGRVRIQIEVGLKLVEITVDASAWCSAVAAVSARGDTAEVWNECLETHNKEK